MRQQAQRQPLTVDRAETVSFTLRELLLYFCDSARSVLVDR